MRIRDVAVLIAAMTVCRTGNAQLKMFVPKTPRDTNYVYNYSDQIHVRFITTSKHTSFTLGGNTATQGKAIRYLSNKPVSIGIGGVYKIYNVNISYGIPFLATPEAERGRTRAIDLQSSIYGRKWVFDLFGQFYRGFYMHNDRELTTEKYTVRPDIRLNVIGGTAHYLFNNKGFSYRAFRINDEWQHKSSGTFSFSFSLFTGKIHSRYAIGFIPEHYPVSFPEENVYKKSFIQLGPGAGYAYNFVFRRNYFLLLSLNGRIMYDTGREWATNGTIARPKGFEPGFTALAAIGYQNNKWGLNLSALNTRNWTSTEMFNNSYKVDIGLIKLTALLRINHTPLTRKMVRPLDHLLLE